MPTQAVGLASTTDTSFALSSSKVLAVGITSEHNQALSVSKGTTDLIIDDANAVSSWLQVDDIDSDVNADSVVASEVLNAVQTVVDDAEAGSSIPVQAQGLSDTVVSDADADSPIVSEIFRLSSVIVDDVNLDSIIASQLAAIEDTLVDDAESEGPVVSETLHATQTVENDVNATSDAEPGVFINDVTSDSVVPSQVLHASVVVVSDANSDSLLVSDNVDSFFEDLIVSDANASSSIEVDLLTAFQLVINDAEAVEEIINDTAGEAWVFNAATQAFSRYTDFDVNQAESIDGVPTFVTPTGVYRFSNSVFADAKVRFGLNSFGAMQTKRLRAIYVTTSGAGTVKLATFHGLSGALVQRNYAAPSRDSDVPINRRISPARGDQGQYWGLQVELTGGGRQVVHGIRILPLVTGRNL